MKKILSVLTTLAFGSTVATTVVACGPAAPALAAITAEKFGEVLKQLANNEEGLVFNIKVNTKKDSPEFWSQIHPQLEKQLAKLNFEIKGQYDLKFGEAPNDEQLSEVGYEWNSGQTNKETGEWAPIAKSFITIYMTDDKGVVLAEGTASDLHWTIKVVA